LMFEQWASSGATNLPLHKIDIWAREWPPPADKMTAHVTKYRKMQYKVRRRTTWQIASYLYRVPKKTVRTPADKFIWGIRKGEIIRHVLFFVICRQKHTVGSENCLWAVNGITIRIAHQKPQASRAFPNPCWCKRKL